MAQTFTTSDLLILGRRTDLYDFKDTETGQQVKGETHVLVTFNPATCQASEVKISNKHLGLFEHVPVCEVIGDSVRLDVNIFARNNRTQETAVGVRTA